MFSGDETGDVVNSGANLPAILALLVSAANMLWTWYERSRSAEGERVKKVEDRLDLVEDRTLRIEGQIVHLPTKDDVNAVKLQLVELLGITNRQQSELAGMVRTVDRIDRYLREKA
nr:DUF2730 family protein [Sphingobium sp. AS12]